MKIVVPLKNLVTDEDFLLNNIQFISTFSTEEYLNNLSIRDDYEKNKNTLLPDLIGFDLDWYYGKTLALIELSEINERDHLFS
ncbi:hypothetical protein ACFTQ7_04250 [Lysinibacillus sp. NPDC056959]|uniref:hypothetical protein n=1 Tax=Lysinibacillus sp. NPDC056959 TaxID=3345981 RepID=UPI00363F6978